ncbi:MAG: hypothetical protein ACKO7N_07110 [Candidatus Nitrosotenuis sp.]
MSIEHHQNPNWDKINVLFDKMDAVLEESFTRDELSFLEAEIAFMLLREKFFEEKLRAYQAYFADDGNNASKTRPPKDFYR